MDMIAKIFGGLVLFFIICLLAEEIIEKMFKSHETKQKQSNT